VRKKLVINLLESAQHTKINTRLYSSVHAVVSIISNFTLLFVQLARDSLQCFQNVTMTKTCLCDQMPKGMERLFMGGL
jgi:hypothetical protein